MEDQALAVWRRLGAAALIVNLAVWAAAGIELARPGPGAMPLAGDVLVRTTAADFLAGTHDGTAVGELDSGAAAGRLHLAAPLADLFLASSLDPLWHVTRPAGGFAPVLAGGILDVQERDDDTYATSALESWATHGAGVVCEVRALVQPGSAFVNLGFTSSTAANDQWAYFSTRGTGNGPVPILKTSVRGATGGTVDVPIAATFGAWHVFRIEWSAGAVAFYVDGELVDQRTGTNLTLPQHVGFYKSEGSASPLLVDWVRVTPYAASTGTYSSPVLDAGVAAAAWTELAWAGEAPAGTAVAFVTRTGETAIPGGGWSAWTEAPGGAIASPPGRYAQFRTALATDDPATSPAVDEVRLAYTYADLVPPAVITTSPPDDADGVPTGARIAATFSEAIDPTTLDATSFRLARPGQGPVGATLSYDPAGPTATLAPQTSLAHAAMYEARLTTAIRDADGNPLAAEHVWSFTTVAADPVAPTIQETVPPTGAPDVLAGRLVTATFSEPIDPATLTDATFTVTPHGGTPVAASVTYDPAALRAILAPVVALGWGVVHEARLGPEVRDLAGNPLAGPVAWTFATRLAPPVTAHATSAVDFAAGTSTGLMITEVDSGAAGGQLRLQGRLSDTFDAPTLSSVWFAANPEGYTPSIVDGVLNVQEQDPNYTGHSSIESQEAWGPGVVLEARAKFVPGSRFIDVGFDQSTNGNNQYAWFSTAGTGDIPGQEKITARVREYDHDTVAIETGATFNEWHVFKIIWTQGRVEFFVDGALVATHTDVVITNPMRAAFYKSNYSEDTPFYIDWIRVTPYTATQGTYESPVVDAGAADTEWFDLEWSGLAPAATSVRFETRTGETPAPGGSWSVWSPLDGDTVASPPGRYAQYRASLATTDPLASPVIDEIFLGREGLADVVAPAVTATLPAAGAVGIAVGASISATFTEPVDPATVTAASFALAAEGRAATASTTSLDATGRTASLVPDGALDFATLYEARLTVAVTDTAGNPLLVEHRWSFTTEPAGPRIPAAAILLPNAPNPFNPATRLTFELAQPDDVRLEVYALDGRLVRTLVSRRLEAGAHSEAWDGLDDAGQAVAAGAYLVRLVTPGATQARKMMLLR